MNFSQFSSKTLLVAQGRGIWYKTAMNTDSPGEGFKAPEIELIVADGPRRDDSKTSTARRCALLGLSESKKAGRRLQKTH